MTKWGSPGAQPLAVSVRWGFYHQGFSVGISTVDLSTKQAAHTDFGHQPTLLLCWAAELLVTGVLGDA